MDYNRVVKIVETKRTADGKNLSRRVQKFNANEQIVQELEYRYDLKDGAEFLREKTEMRYNDTGKIKSKYKFTGHYPSDTGFWARDLEKMITYEYDVDGRVIKVIEEGDNEHTEGRCEYITVLEYSEDGTSIGKQYPAQFYNDPRYHNYVTKYYDKAGHLVMEDRGHLKKYWDYDEHGNMVLEHWVNDKPNPGDSIKPGVDTPLFKYEYDKRGNQIAYYSFSSENRELYSTEIHYVFNEEDQEIMRIDKIWNGQPVDKCTTYEYEATVHNVDSADIEDGAVTVATDLPQNAQILLEKAKQNDANAMAEVASNYYSGKNGFPSDDNLAFYWSKKVTEAYPTYNYAWELLGRCYEFGVGTEKNAPKAIAVLKKSIELGKTDILYDLAELIYFESDENEKAECLPFLEKAISNQSSEAESLLGCIYLKGELQTNNRQRGIELLTNAAKHGDSEGARILAEAYLHQIKGSEHIVPYDISKASQYFAIAVDNGEDTPKAMYYAGPAYFYGEGIPKNMEKARKCFETLIDEYVPEEKVFDLLGCMCFEGVGGRTDYTLGEKALRRAIGSDDAKISLEAMSNLGMYLYTLTNRLSEAIQLLQRAADQGNANAQVNLGKAYYEGKGVSQNIETAAYYFGLAAEQGNQTAIDNLKVMGTSSNFYNNNSAKKRHPIRGAIIGYFVGGIIAIIPGQFSPALGWAIVILAVVIGIIKG